MTLDLTADAAHRARPDRARRCWCSARRSAPRSPLCGPRARRGLADTSTSSAGTCPGTAAAPPADEPFTMADLAAGRAATSSTTVLAGARRAGRFRSLRRRLGRRRGRAAAAARPPGPGRRGRDPARTGAKIGDAGAGRERADLVRAAGTAGPGRGLRRRWFAPGLPRPRAGDAPPRCCTRCRTRTGSSYAGSARRWPLRRPGPARRDQHAGARRRRRVRRGHPDRPSAGDRRRRAGRPASSSSSGVAHLPPAEHRPPWPIADRLRPSRRAADRRGTCGADGDAREVYDAGMAVRREVLGDAHVDRATAVGRRLHRATSRSSSPGTPGARSGPVPAWTVGPAP